MQTDERADYGSLFEFDAWFGPEKTLDEFVKIVRARHFTKKNPCNSFISVKQRSLRNLNQIPEKT